jgi:hypothetical protein
MPDFFAQVDDMGIVENHIQSVLKLEDAEASRLLRRYREIRGDLRDRLDRLPGDTFTAQQLRGVMTQVDGAIQAMNSSLQTGMKDAAFGAAMKGVEDQIKELRAFSEKFVGAVVPINLNAQLVAQDTQNFLLNRYESSLDAYTEDVRNNLVLSLTNESLMESPYSTVVRKLGAFFQGEEWKLHRIARTELHNVYNTGKLNGMTEVQDTTLPDLMKTLIHPMDGRTGADSKYAARLDLIVPLDEPFKYRWKGETRVFMVPPDRPNDRSILVPYRQAWNS